jgi:hypothetical protein
MGSAHTMGAIGYCQQKGDNQVRLHIYPTRLIVVAPFFFFDLDTDKEFDFFFLIFFFIILE